MSIETDSGKKIAEAKNKIKEAHRLLISAMDEETWGHDDYKSEYLTAVHEVIAEMYVIKKKLG